MWEKVSEARQVRSTAKFLVPLVLIPSLAEFALLAGKFLHWSVGVMANTPIQYSPEFAISSVVFGGVFGFIGCIASWIALSE